MQMKSRMLWVGSALLALVVSGCTLLPTTGEPDYADWARQLVEQAGSDEVTSFSLRETQLNMTIRAGGADTGWSIGSSSDIQQTGDETDRPRSTLKADTIDWTAIAEAIPRTENCNDPIVQVDVLPAGQIYQRSSCDPATPATNVTLDGQPIPDRIVGEDAAALQQFIDIAEPLIPNRAVYDLGIALEGLPGAKSLIGLVTLADGREVAFSITYANENPNWNEPLSLTAGDVVDVYPANPVSSTQRPEFAFRPSDYPAAAFADAITSGRTQLPEGSTAEFMNFSAISDTELSWLMMGGFTERARGTITR